MKTGRPPWRPARSIFYAVFALYRKNPTILQATAAARQASCGAFPGRSARAQTPGPQYPRIPASRIHACQSCRSAACVSSPARDPNTCARKSRSSCAAAVAGLHQGEHFPELVHCAVAAGKNNQRLGKLREPQLAHEKIMEHEAQFRADVVIRTLF